MATPIHASAKVFIISFLLFSACESAPEPLASFEMDKEAAQTGESISFLNTSQHASSYKWDFGDGSSSTDENPTHSYSNPKVFIVSLTATGEGGSNSGDGTVIVWDLALEGTFYGDSTGYNGPETFKTQTVKLDFCNKSTELAMVNMILHAEGQTHEDMLDLFPGGVSYGHHPPGTTEVRGVYGHAGPDGILSWYGHLAPGLYTLVGATEFPLVVWYVAGLTVTDQ